MHVAVTATVPDGSAQPPSPEAAGSRRRWRLWIPAGIAVVAFLSRLIPVLRGGGLFGVDTYDPSVYYAAAVGLFSGRLPYQDFLLLHPPGILIALQPFAALGAVVGDPDAMASARVAFMLLGAGSTLLVYRILTPQHRYAALVGAGAYAVWYPAVYSERSVRLEAVATFVVLVGILLLQRWLAEPSTILMLGAGAMFGLGAAVKIWGVVPVVVLLIWLAWRHGWRPAAVALAGAAGAVLLVLVPFGMAWPELWRMVILDQLGRPRTAALVIAGRFVDILGLAFLPRLVAIVPALLLGAATLAALWLAWRNTLGQLFVLLTVASGLTLLASPTWFGHYAAFLAAPLCLVYGTAFSEFLKVTAGQKNRRVAITIVMSGLAIIGTVVMAKHDGTPLEGQQLASVLADRAGCVTTDNPTTLIFSNTLRRNLAAGCPLVVDLGGYIYDLYSAGGSIRRASNPAFQRFALHYLGRGTATALIRFGPGDLSRHSRRVIDTWPILGQYGPLIVRQPPH
jgi:4-amino-4-deoxy-L-arabinose transferase-like glycosyltransferase